LSLFFIWFVSDLRQDSGFSPGIPVSSTNKTDRHNMTEILLKLALNTLTLTPYFLSVVAVISGFLLALLGIAT